jgi:hypothetical protein
MRGHEEVASAPEFEIGAQFRRMMEERIARLESGATMDEATLQHLENTEHIRRQMRLIAAQREEASRIRRFLDQSRTRIATLAE